MKETLSCQILAAAKAICQRLSYYLVDISNGTSIANSESIALRTTFRSRVTRDLDNILAHNNPTFVSHARLRLQEISESIRELATGTLSFAATETWRSVYEELLDGVATRRYLSVAVIRTEDYWQSEPGKRSLEFNYQLVEHSFYVARICILDEFLWPPGARRPAKSIDQWLDQQHQRGITVFLIRQNDIENEPELQRDFGIYGDAAVGYQATDLQGLTEKFELHFCDSQVQAAQETWKRLLLYATRFEYMNNQYL